MSRGRIIPGFSLESCLVCPVSGDKFQVKLIFEEEQLQFERSFISRLDKYLETREGFLSLFFVLNV
jgi:hypothetical protein